MAQPSKQNNPVPGLPYFSPQHDTIPGVPLRSSLSNPTLFRPLTIRDTTLKNRILVAPMCQYSCAPSGSQIGALTPYHIATLGNFALKGAALVFIEATGVQPNGRISPNCSGIWSDEQIPGIKAIADFCHAQGALCGLQLAHAGRKGSTLPPYVALRFGKHSMKAGVEEFGWPENVVGPSGGEDHTWDSNGGGYWPPRELSVQEIEEVIQDFAKAAKRGVQAGVDVLEIHGAHGYLIHQFLSPITNRRTDHYGGSFHNRIRILIEIIGAIRKAIPESMPLYLRISSTEWMEETDLGKKLGSWDVESTIALAKIISETGIDLLDVSSGGNHPQQRVSMFNTKDYQTKIAARIRKELRADGRKMFIGAVGLITEAEQARRIVDVEADDEPMADVILVARQFMREPEWVLKVAHHLGVNVSWSSQSLRIRFPKL